jgi:hypothetical protein
MTEQGTRREESVVTVVTVVRGIMQNRSMCWLVGGSDMGLQSIETAMQSEKKCCGPCENLGWPSVARQVKTRSSNGAEKTGTLDTYEN